MGFLGGLGDFISNKPEQFAIMADLLGQGFDPNNAFAGIGTAMGKSSLANKALGEEKKERQDWLSMVADIVSGKQPLSATGIEGPSALSMKPGKEGGTETTLSISNPISEGTPAVHAASSGQPALVPVKKQDLGGLISSPF